MTLQNKSTGYENKDTVDESKPTVFHTTKEAFSVYGSSDNGKIEPIPAEVLKASESSPADEIKMPTIPVNPDNSIDHDKLQRENDIAYIAELEERHCQDMEIIENLHKERYKEIERGDYWRDKHEALLTKYEKQEIDHDTKVRNLEYENGLLEKKLQLHAEDESLLFLTMEKAVQMRNRVLEVGY